MALAPGYCLAGWSGPGKLQGPAISILNGFARVVWTSNQSQGLVQRFYAVRNVLDACFGFDDVVDGSKGVLCLVMLATEI